MKTRVWSPRLAADGVAALATLVGVGVGALAGLLSSVPAAAQESGPVSAAEGAPVVVRAGAPATAQESQILVSAEWLAAHRDDPNLVLLGMGIARRGLPEEMIPGARFLEYDDIAIDTELRTELPPVEDLVATFRAAGVSNESHVVVYGDPAHLVARVFMTLDYLGHGDRTSVLDGGIAAWKAAGGETAAAFSEGSAGSFEPHVRDDMLVSAEWIRDRLEDPSVTLIDARPEIEYTGERAGNGLRGGHIPGAYNLYWVDLTQSEELPKLRDIAEVQARYDEAGATKDGLVVNYCLIGMRASYTYMISRHLGYDARFYDASWNEWGAREDLPLVEGKAR